MLRFLLTRVSLLIPTFFGMTLLAFFLLRLVPGDPIETMAGERGIDAARHAALLVEYGLDKPVLTQYGTFRFGPCDAWVRQRFVAEGFVSAIGHEASARLLSAAISRSTSSAS